MLFDLRKKKKILTLSITVNFSKCNFAWMLERKTKEDIYSK